jgi:hypothetical protein
MGLKPSHMSWRQLARQLGSAVGLSPRGFFIPYRYAAHVAPIDYPALAPLFEEATPAMLRLLAVAALYEAEIAGCRGPAPEPRLDQDWFPRLDAVSAYAMVREMRPQRIVEIGSGHSTRFLARAARDGDLPTRILCIDPAPRAPLPHGVTHRAALLAAHARPDIEALRAGDILFVDSSHVAMPGSDVDQIMLDVLPRLPRGVLIHVHDVTLPDAYPATWAWRAYNEQTVVGALLVGGGFEVLWSSHWLRTRAVHAVNASFVSRLPLRSGAFETSLWLRKLT